MQSIAAKPCFLMSRRILYNVTRSASLGRLLTARTYCLPVCQNQDLLRKSSPSGFQIRKKSNILLVENPHFRVDRFLTTKSNIKNEISAEHDDSSNKRAKPQLGLLQQCRRDVDPYLRLIRFDRPIGSWLLFWPCGWSIALAAGPGCWPDPLMLGVFATGAFVMRGAGCTINDMWDRKIDAQVERTRERPLASGELSQLDALVFLAAQLGIGLQVKTKRELFVFYYFI